MKQEGFSILVSSNHFVTISGARLTAVKPGHVCHPREAQEEGTRNGSRSTRPTAWGTDSNTTPGVPLPLAALVNLAGPQMVDSRGRVHSVFLIRRCGARSTWTPTATFLSAAQATSPARSGAFVQAMGRTRT